MTWKLKAYRVCYKPIGEITLPLGARVFPLFLRRKPMQQASFVDYSQHCPRTDLAFFELMRSIAELHEYEHELSALDIEQIQVGARILNGIITRNAEKLI